MPDQIPLMSRELMDRYEPLAVIGFGAFAIVVQARDRSTGRLVAIKRFQTRGGDKRKFFGELRVILRLRHPHIVRCLDLCDGDGDSSELVFEFADGGSLREQMKMGEAWGVDDSMRVAHRLAQGLVYAHRKGIVHRDVKPENILVFGGGEESAPIHKITDFGIAKFIGPRAKTLTSIGSPIYMAPEQFFDEYDNKTDVYGLGVVFYELTHGAPPFEGSAAALFKGHMEAPIPVSRGLDQDARKLIMSAMAKKPAERPSAREFLALLDEIMNRRGLAAPTAPGTLEDDDRPAPAEASSGDKPGTARPATAQALFNLGSPAPQSAFGGAKSPPTASPARAERAPMASTGNAAPAEPSPLALIFGSKVIGDDLNQPSATGLFKGGFGEAERARLESIEVADAGATRSARRGGIHVALEWSRAVDTRAVAVLNMGPGRSPVVVTRDAIYEIKPEGTKSRTRYFGSLKFVGRPTRWGLAFQDAEGFKILRDEETVPVGASNVAAPDELLAWGDEGALLARMGRRVCRFGAAGELEWEFELGESAAHPRSHVDAAGRAVIVELKTRGGAAIFLDSAGRVAARHELPLPACAVGAPSEDGVAWLMLNGEECHELARLSFEGVESVCGVDQAFQLLAGDALWACGASEGGRVHVIDPATGLIARAPIEGRTLSIDRGVNPRQGLVLEGRDEILKYVSAFEVIIGDR